MPAPAPLSGEEARGEGTTGEPARGEGAREPSACLEDSNGEAAGEELRLPTPRDRITPGAGSGDDSCRDALSSSAWAPGERSGQIGSNADFHRLVVVVGTAGVAAAVEDPEAAGEAPPTVAAGDPSESKGRCGFGFGGRGGPQLAVPLLHRTTPLLKPSSGDSRPLAFGVAGRLPLLPPKVVASSEPKPSFSRNSRSSCTRRCALAASRSSLGTKLARPGRGLLQQLLLSRAALASSCAVGGPTPLRGLSC